MSDIQSRAEKVAASVGPLSDEIEQARQMPDAAVQAIRDSDLNRLFVPAIYGGFEAHPVEAMKAIETVAAADASAGWCLGIGSTTGLNAAFLAEGFAREIYGRPGAWTAGVFAPNGRAVEDGDDYVVNGKWSWGSGTRHADYVVGGCFVVGDDGKPIPPVMSRMMIAKADQISFDDTWHVLGLKGTGSTDFEMQNIRVPKGRSVALQADPLQVEGALYAFPSFALLACGIAATALGIGRAALEDFTALAEAKTPQYSKKSLANKPLAQVDFARASALIGSARAFAHEATHKAYEAAEAGGAIPDEVRATLRLSYTTAVKNVAEAVQLLYTAGGGSSLFLSHPLQRHWRDINTATQHIMINSATYELTGRVLLGVETDTAML